MRNITTTLEINALVEMATVIELKEAALIELRQLNEKE